MEGHLIPSSKQLRKTTLADSNKLGKFYVVIAPERLEVLACLLLDGQRKLYPVCLPFVPITLCFFISESKTEKLLTLLPVRDHGGVTAQ